MKSTVDPTDTTSKEKKIQLLNLDASMSYNFVADSVKFSPLRINARTQVAEWFSFNAGSTFSLYHANETGREVNRFYYKTGAPLRLTDFNFSISTSLSGERLKSTETEEVLPPESEYHLGSAENRVYRGLYDERDADFSIPWDISLSYTFNYRKPIPTRIDKSSSLNANLNFNLTPQWKFSFSGIYDIDNKQIAAPSVRISRDLHCWLMNFTWNPIGKLQGLSF
jgi:hypothetical protein